MKLLNELQNHQIYPYFWDLFEKNHTSIEVSYIDLELLKASLARGELDDDRDLEAVLYGVEARPFFSGWTGRRLVSTLSESGFSSPEAKFQKDCQTTVVAERTDWGLKDLARAKKKRRAQQIWHFRKSLRLKAAEMGARAKALMKSDPTKRNELFLNLGAGAENYEDYLKIDWGGCQHIYDDIVTLRKIRDGSVAKIYTNHVLEHIPPKLIRPMLNRWKEVLKPGGTLLARAPDVRQSILALNDPWTEAKDERIRELGFPDYLAREQTRSGVLDDVSTIQAAFGWSDSTPHAWDMSNQHKSLWTPDLARARFEEAGFVVKVAENLGSIQTAVVAHKL